MADSVTNIQSTYEKYKSYFAIKASDSLDQKDFLKLMVEQLKNQDFSNPTDSTQFIAQMAQFSALNSQMEATYYTQAAYAATLVGKTVAVGYTNSSGQYATDTGVVSSLKFNGNSFEFVVNGKTYEPKNIMQVLASSSSDDSSSSSGKVSATKQINLSTVDGIASFTKTPSVTIGFLDGQQNTPVTLAIESGDKDAVKSYTVGENATLLTIQLKDLDSITSTSELASRINAAISNEIANPSNPDSPIMTSKNFTAGKISISVDMTDVERSDGFNLTEDDLADINEAAVRTLLSYSSIKLS